MTEKPLVLLTNDDGLDAPGIKVLEEALKGWADLWIIAPDSQRSGASHAISFHRSLWFKELPAQRFVTCGTPADCVWFGVNQLLPRRPDLVVSGINHGGNLGIDVWYSGTVQAALEGALNGIPAVAVSCVGYKEFAFSAGAAVALPLVQEIHRRQLRTGILFNVNVPEAPRLRTPLAVNWTRLGDKKYRPKIETSRDDQGRLVCKAILTGIDYGEIPYSDCSAISAGCVSITPLLLDITDFHELDGVGGWPLPGLATEAYRGAKTPLPREVFNMGIR